MKAVLELHKQQQEMHSQEKNFLNEINRGMVPSPEEEEEISETDTRMWTVRYGNIIRKTGNFILSRDVCTDWTFTQMFNVKKDLYNKIKIDLIAFKPEVWDPISSSCEKLSMTAEIRIWIVLSALRSGKYNAARNENHVVATTEVRFLLQEFCDFICSQYGTVFLNRTPSSEELVEIEKNFCKKGFPGCAGFPESSIMRSGVSVQNGWNAMGDVNQRNTNGMALEVWIDMDNYCWSWSQIESTKCGNDNELSCSPVLKDVFRSEINLIQDKVYCMEPATIKRHLLYFCVEGDYPKWPLFIE